MKPIIQNINELSDSKELLEAKPHPRILITIYIIFAFLATAIIWAYYSEIDDYVKATGIIKPYDKISTVRNMVTGKVASVQYSNGKKVRKGEALFVIDHSNLDADKTKLLQNLDKLKLELEKLKKLEQSIEEDKNYFDSINEKDYYNKYVKYDIDMRLNAEQISNNNVQLEQNKKNADVDYQVAQDRVNTNNQQLNNLILLKKSIECGNNLFSSDNKMYFDKYENYAKNVRILRADVDMKKESYQQIKDSNKSNTNTFNIQVLKSIYEDADAQLSRYKSSYIQDISNNIEQLAASINGLNLNLKKAKDILENSNAINQNSDIMRQKYKINALVQLDDSIKSNSNNIDKFENDLSSLNFNISESTVVAPIDGIINSMGEVNVGDLLQSGAEIMTIIPEKNFQYKIELMVSNKDVANIKVGQLINYRFLALPSKEYGELSGEIVKIGDDSIREKENNDGYYIVEGDIKNKKLYSYKGTEAEIKVGMLCEAHVITRTKKILNYILEQMNFKD